MLEATKEKERERDAGEVYCYIVFHPRLVLLLRFAVSRLLMECLASSQFTWWRCFSLMVVVVVVVVVVVIVVSGVVVVQRGER